MDIFRKQVEEVLRKNKITGKLEKPPEGIGADLALPCFGLAKEMGKSPALIAEELAGRIKPSGALERVENAGPYLNFYADWGRLGDLVLGNILKKGERYGSGMEGRKILVEHTSANPDGPLHLGHFRNSVIGDSLARLMVFMGNRVSTICLVNDTGRQIAIAVMEYMKGGRGKKGLPANTKRTKQAPSRDARRRDKGDWTILDLYLKGNRKIEKDKGLEEEIQGIIRRFESGERKLREIFHSLTEECLKGHRETLSNLGIGIGEFFRESASLFDGSVEGILGRVRRLGEGREDGKRVWVDLKKFGIEREFTLTREDGTTIYPARDLAFHQYKFSKAPYNINVIGTDQRFYFSQLISALRLLLPRQTGNYRVVFYEFLLLPEGSMSTRAGRFVSVDEVLEKAFVLARKEIKEKFPAKEKEKIARAVGCGALKYAMLKASPEKTYSFSVEDALSFEGNNAPYIQYTHARCCSILRKGKVKRVGGFRAEHLKGGREKEILKRLAEFPGVLEKAGRDLRPHYICTYLYELSDLFNNFYQSLPVLKAEKGVREARIALVLGVKTVLGIGLNLLGIEALESM